MDDDTSWFDNIYGDGRKPSLKDKQELFAQSVREIGLRVPDRAKSKIEEKIRYYLFKMKRNYSPGVEILAHNYIFCLAPCAGIDRDRINEYRKQYSELILRHAKNRPFDINYDEQEVE
jgi:hypothetical protein